MQLIPLDPIDADFKQTVSLDGSAYVLRFSYSDRSGDWFMDVALQTDDEPLPIVTGVRVSVDWPLMIGVTTEGRPPGELFAFGPADPGREDLGTQVRLFYVPLEELSE